VISPTKKGVMVVTNTCKGKIYQHWRIAITNDKQRDFTTISFSDETVDQALGYAVHLRDRVEKLGLAIIRYEEK